MPSWILALAGKHIDEEVFDSMTLEQQSWWLDTMPDPELQLLQFEW